MSVVLHLRRHLAAREQKWLRDSLVAMGIEPRPIAGRRDLWSLGNPSEDRLDGVADLWGVKAIASLDGTIQIPGRRSWLEFVLPKLILGLVLLVLLILLSTWFPGELGARPDVHLPPKHLCPQWYMIGITLLFSSFGESWTFLGPLLLCTTLLFLVFVPFIETSSEVHWRKRPLALGLGVLVLGLIIVLTIYGYSTM